MAERKEKSLLTSLHILFVLQGRREDKSGVAGARLKGNGDEPLEEKTKKKDCIKRLRLLGEDGKEDFRTYIDRRRFGV